MESERPKKQVLERINIGEKSRNEIFDYIFNFKEKKFVYNVNNFRLAADYIPILKEPILKQTCLHQDTKDFIEICYKEINKIAKICESYKFNSLDHYIFIIKIHRFHEITMRYLSFIRYIKNELLMINIVFYDMFGSKDLKLLKLFKDLMSNLRNIDSNTLMNLSMDDICESNKIPLIPETIIV